MRAALILVGFVFAWVALYQGIVALGSPAVRDDELVRVSGVVRHVHTPLMRNRQVAQALLEIEVAPARVLSVPIPLAALPLDAVRALEGGTVTTVYAGRRPRNRWIYDLRVGDRHLVRLDEQRRRDATDRATHLRWMVVMGFVATVLFFVALRPPRRFAR